MKRYGSTTCAAVAQKRAGDKVTVVGIVAGLRERMNKEKGTRFGFVTLEDLTGTVEVICWASRASQNGRPAQKGWADWELLLKGDEPVVVHGEVKINNREEENPRAELTAIDVLPLAAVRNQKTSEVAFRIDAERLTRDRAGDLRTLLGPPPGRLRRHRPRRHPRAVRDHHLGAEQGPADRRPDRVGPADGVRGGAEVGGQAAGPPGR